MMTAQILAEAVEPQSLVIGTLLKAYAAGTLTPERVIKLIYRRIASSGATGVWIHLVPEEASLARARELANSDPATLPLYGIPFAIKDNIDLAGHPTTAACEAFARVPKVSATVVDRLVAAGAIPIGKTNLDQFATGLVGTRSPFGVCANSFDPAYISGGSSSGSAVATALGFSSFALGTDTAGSGRIPAAFNNLVGLKPTLGRLSTRGVVPACRSLDAVSIFALCAEDAQRISSVAAAFDSQDAYARPAPSVRPTVPLEGFKFAIPRPGQLEFFGNGPYASGFAHACARLATLGGVAQEVDIEPLLEAARLLYEGPWVAERYVAIETLFQTNPGALHPVTRQIIGAGASPSAAGLFKALYRLQALKREAEALWKSSDVLLLPTAPTHYRIAEVLEDPILLNSRLGLYTNFVNLLDMAAVAVPAGVGEGPLPFGVTLIGPAWSDDALLRIAAKLHRALPATEGASGRPLPEEQDFEWPPGDQTMALAVCGAHMRGLPLNPQLTSLGATLLQRTTTSEHYRLYALPGGPPHRPGLVRVDTGGAAIELEVWSVPRSGLGQFMASIPAPLCIGKVQLADGSCVSGFLCETAGLSGSRDITEFGGWRGYLASRS